MSTEQTVKELLSAANPGSIDGPGKYSAAYEIYKMVPKRFEFIYGNAIRSIRSKKGIKHVGIFAHEVSLFPEKGMPKDISYDLKAGHDFFLDRGETVKVLTGVRLIMPDYMYASVRGRSGLSLKGIDVLAGVIDPQYRGEVGVTLTRTSTGASTVHVRNEEHINVEMHLSDERLFFDKGDRIAQLIFVPHQVFVYPIFEIDKIPTTDRGEKGYGSTGNSSRET